MGFPERIYDKIHGHKENNIGLWDWILFLTKYLPIWME
jgi:hypothetical protein